MSKETLTPSFKIVEVAEPPRPVKTTQYFVFDDYIKLHEQIVLDDYKHAKPATFNRELTDFKPAIISGIRYFQLSYGFGPTPYLLTEQGYKDMILKIAPRYTAEIPVNGRTLYTPAFVSKQDLISYLRESTRSELLVLKNSHLTKIDNLKAQIAEHQAIIANLTEDSYLTSLVKMEFYVSVNNDELDLPVINTWEDMKKLETKHD